MGYGYYDGTYLIMAIIIMVIPLYASMKVQNTFNKYSKVRTLSGYSGEEAARRILMMNNINIPIQPIRGSMTDFYDPVKKELALSQTVYGAYSIAALGVAAHEVGHAIQDAKGYAFLRFRHAMYPATNFASRLSMPLIFLGVIVGIGPFLQLGILLFALTTLFALVTLPVEFDASKRALVSLETSGILGPQELDGARKVLNAAALTYVAAAMVSILSLLRLLLISGRRDD
ncbi:MAG: peptidase rane zinc metallopeptidase [Clostridia bacterium]|jgi:Zn-dependent membrane protease YugP|nr:peptidase rane zinc metallopeptidase [Clostridia bacterium]